MSYARHSHQIMIYYFFGVVNKEKTMVESHLIALEAKHAHLDKRLADETLRPKPDSFLIATLKKQKLRIKEALRRH